MADSRSLTLNVLVGFAFAGLAGSAQNVPNLKAFSATVEDTFTRTLADGNIVTKTVTGQYYRDAQGRSRLERGQIITIKDPTTRTVAIVDSSTNTVKRFVASPSPEATSSSTAVSMGDATAHHPARTDLGTRVLSGVPVKGTRATFTIPGGAIGNLHPLTQTTEIWRSDDLAVAVEVKSIDPINGEHIQVFTNIVTGVTVDPSQFAIPAGAQITDVQAPQKNAASQRLR